MNGVEKMITRNTLRNFSAFIAASVVALMLTLMAGCAADGPLTLTRRLDHLDWLADKERFHNMPDGWTVIPLEQPATSKIMARDIVWQMIGANLLYKIGETAQFGRIERVNGYYLVEVKAKNAGAVIVIDSMSPQAAGRVYAQ